MEENKENKEIQIIKKALQRIEIELDKCRTKDFDNCHSIRCPMRKEEETVKSEWDRRKCFEQLRLDNDYYHLGLGDIRLTIAQQEEICELVERYYRCT